MMSTPSVHLEESRDDYSNLAPNLKSTEVRLLYVTDRAPEQDDEGELRYGSGRSDSLGFGSVVVDLGVDITWEELVEASRTETRLQSVELELGELVEIGRGPPVPLPFTEIDGQVVEEPRLVTQRDEATEA